MITVSHHDARYIALRGAYEHKAAIKSLSDYPDVLWDGETKAWLVDNRLWDDLAQLLGPWIAPAPVAFWMDFTPYEEPPVQRRRTKQQVMADKRKAQEAASEVGRAIVGNKERMRWP